MQNSQNEGKGNILSKIPTAINHLINLKKLVISGIPLVERYIDPCWDDWTITKIENLPQSITHLNISNNNIEKIENLPQSITYLDISHNRIDRIENLPQSIKHLNIGRNYIKEIENLPQSITYLDIYENEIRKIENLPQNIIYLDISENVKIKKIENLPQSITKLYIRFCDITDLQPLLPFIKKGIDYNIEENPIENPPDEVNIDSAEAMIRYFEEVEKSGKTQVKEAKLLLTGSGEVGKTSLRYRIIDKKKALPKKEARTKQIDVDKYHFDTSEGDFTAHIWDFGGQQIIHHFQMILIIGCRRFNYTEKRVLFYLYKINETGCRVLWILAIIKIISISKMNYTMSIYWIMKA